MFFLFYTMLEDNYISWMILKLDTHDIEFHTWLNTEHLFRYWGNLFSLTVHNVSDTNSLITTILCLLYTCLLLRLLGTNICYPGAYCSTEWMPCIKHAIKYLRFACIRGMYFWRSKVFRHTMLAFSINSLTPTNSKICWVVAGEVVLGAVPQLFNHL